MKKIIFVIFSVLFCAFLYFYQTSIIEEHEAVSIALNTLRNPPPGFIFDISNPESLEQKAYIEAHLTERKRGFVNKIFNRQQWEVLINTDHIEVTIYISAYNGKLLNIIGALS